jgi:hypothetical protein
VGLSASIASRVASQHPAPAIPSCFILATHALCLLLTDCPFHQACTFKASLYQVYVQDTGVRQWEAQSKALHSSAASLRNT